MTSDSTAAWRLFEAAEACLTDDQRTIVCIELGSGENHLAIERILNAVAQNRFPLPAATYTMLATWLDLYTGSAEERRLRTLLTDIQSR